MLGESLATHPFYSCHRTSSIPSAIEGIRLGIQDYLLKPLDLDDLVHSIQRTIPIDRIDSSDDFADILVRANPFNN